jgi:hypothetical protein
MFVLGLLFRHPAAPYLRALRRTAGELEKTRQSVPDAEDGPESEGIGQRNTKSEPRRLTDDRDYFFQPESEFQLLQPPGLRNAPDASDHLAGRTRRCGAITPSIDGSAVQCSSFIQDQLILKWVPPLANFVIMQPPKPHREVVILPEDGYRAGEGTHLTNEDLLGSVEAWGAFIEFASMFKALSVELNFGKWEKVQYDDQALQGCHGHAHFYFDREGWESLIDMEWSSPETRGLKRRMAQIRAPPPSRRMHDCQELERERLSDARAEVLLKALQDVGQAQTCCA